MRNVAVVRTQSQVARPIKTLVPLIKDELAEADAAGLEHYRQAGEMLIEAKDQISHGSWSPWLKKNFELSQDTARRYMRLARIDDFKTVLKDGIGLYEAIGQKQGRAKWKPLFEATDRVNVTRLADERQTRDHEIKLHRELALKLIDLGYRAMATRLHPDSRGGSKDAMRRLNVVRDELKGIAATRRFI